MGPGTVLADRYAVQRRLAQWPDRERWSAHDTTLEREVTLTVFSADHRNADAALDAARRAAGVEDSRLVRVFDVGREEAVAYIVEESLPGAQPVSALLGQGGLPAEEVRRIAGEAATGLETGRSRGLHHLRLTPREVLRAADGTIKVSGLAVVAALDGAEQTDPTAASRADAVALVALAYAGLTSRWPMARRVDGLEQAPRVAAGVAAPSEIAAGVPLDLDTLCRLTLNEDAGPLDPGDFASQIAPWSRQPVHSDGSREQTVEFQLPLDGPTSGGTGAAVAAGAGAGAAGAGAAGADFARASAGPSRPRAGGSSSDAPTAELAPVTAPQQVPAQVAASGPAARSGAAPAGSGEAAEGSGHAAGAVAALGGTLAAAGTAAGTMGVKVGSFAKAAAEKAAQKAAAARQSRNEGVEDQDWLPEELIVGTATPEPIEPPLPMLHTGAEAPTREQSKLVVVIVAGFVIVALLLGYLGLAGLGSDGGASAITPRRTVTVTASPSAPSSSPTPSTTTSTPPAGPIKVASATGFDPPPGDGQEKNSLAPKAVDGDPASAWTSEGYNSADFGGLKKGVGLLLDLGTPQPLHAVKLLLPAGQSDLTVFAANQPVIDGATPVGNVAGGSGEATVNAPPGLAPSRYVIVWFTKLPNDGTRFRASLSEVTLS